MESMDSMGSETKEFHQKAWGKFHGNPLEQNSMESMEYLPCFPMLAWGSDYVESVKKMCIGARIFFLEGRQYLVDVDVQYLFYHPS